MEKQTNGFNDLPISCVEIKIPVPWGHISGKWWGSRDKQPVLAIHGWQDNAGTFDNLAPLLAKDIPIFCIDLPGHGWSSHYPEGQYYYVFWDGILVVRRIVQYFEWKKIKMMGHSLGGGIAFLYAASYPDEIDSYVSIDIASPSVRDPVEMVSAIGESVDRFLKYETLSEESMPCYDKEEMLKIVYDAYNGAVTKECCEIMMKRGMRQAKKDNTYFFNRDPRLKVPTLAFMTMDQVMEFASRITCSVMNIRASPGLRWKAETYDIVLNKIEDTARRMERHTIEGTHHLHLNNAESIAGIIRKFLLLE